jgi:hypothetical protein
MIILVKHLTTGTPIQVEIPEGYMLTVDYNQVIHLMDGKDQFLVFDQFTRKFLTPDEYGFKNDGIRYMTVHDKPVKVGDTFLVVEKIRY